MAARHRHHFFCASYPVKPVPRIPSIVCLVSREVCPVSRQFVPRIPCFFAPYSVKIFVCPARHGLLADKETLLRGGRRFIDDDILVLKGIIPNELYFFELI